MWVPWPLEEAERICLAFFLKALTQGLLYCSKPLAELGRLEHAGWEGGYHAHFLYFCVSQ